MEKTMVYKRLPAVVMKSLRMIVLRRSSSAVNIEKLEQESKSDQHINVIDDEALLKKEALEKSRNKSRLYDSHRNILHEINPYTESMSWHHETLKHLRRTYGKYGKASGMNPGMCWPTKQELNITKQYESVAYPYKILEVMKNVAENNKVKKAQIQERQSQIVQKMLKLEEWKKGLFDKIQKKENEAKAARERKERLIEEVRAHFGYQVDPRDAKFKELLEKKEKEQKKALKEERRMKKQDKMVEKILQKNKDARNEPVEN